MMVADGNGQGVGGVGRARRLLEAEKRLDHPLNLTFPRSAIPCYGAFDLQWTVLCNGEPALGGGEEGDPSHLAQLERTLRVFREDEGFDGGPVRMMASDQLGQTGEDLLQSRREWFTR